MSRLYIDISILAQKFSRPRYNRAQHLKAAVNTLRAHTSGSVCSAVAIAWLLQSV